MESQRAIPSWIFIVSGLFALLEIGVSFSLIFAPESVVENVDVTASGVTYIIQMWAARQFALGVIFAVATFKKSRQMLTLAYIFFLVMFIGDLIIGIAQNEMSLIIAAVVMCIISVSMLFLLNRKADSYSKA